MNHTERKGQFECLPLRCYDLSWYAGKGLPLVPLRLQRYRDNHTGRRDTESEGAISFACKFLHPGPVTDDLLNYFTSASIFTTEEKYSNFVFSKSLQFKWIIANSFVARDQNKLLVSNIIEPFFVLSLGGKLIC